MRYFVLLCCVVLVSARPEGGYRYEPSASSPKGGNPLSCCQRLALLQRLHNSKSSHANAYGGDSVSSSGYSSGQTSARIVNGHSSGGYSSSGYTSNGLSNTQTSNGYVQSSNGLSNTNTAVHGGTSSHPSGTAGYNTNYASNGLTSLSLPSTSLGNVQANTGSSDTYSGASSGYASGVGTYIGTSGGYTSNGLTTGHTSSSGLANGHTSSSGLTSGHTSSNDLTSGHTSGALTSGHTSGALTSGPASGTYTQASQSIGSGNLYSGHTSANSIRGSSGSGFIGGSGSGASFTPSNFNKGSLSVTGNELIGSASSGSFSTAELGGGFSSGSSTGLVQKHIYVHVPPQDDEEELVRAKYEALMQPKKHYKIIFIKAPTPPSFPTAQLIANAGQQEEKTLVYVLVKKPEEPSMAEIKAAQAAIQPNKPEVYFIKYKTREQHPGIGAVGGGGFTDGSFSGTDLSSYSTNNQAFSYNSAALSLADSVSITTEIPSDSYGIPPTPSTLYGPAS